MLYLCQDHGESNLRERYITFFQEGTNSRIFIWTMKTGTVPQQITLLTKHETEKMITRLSQISGCNLKLSRESLRISENEKTGRDLMIYMLWQTGRFTNQEIAKLFGLTYSSVSRRVGIVRKNSARINWLKISLTVLML